MFNVGDKVVYPMHGAGIIEAIEEKEILGATKKYYVMRLPVGDMKVMIPIDSCTQVGLREIVCQEMVEQVFDVLQSHDQIEVSANWNRRYRDHLEKIKSGNILDVAEVVRNLTIRDRVKGLSTGERKMLESARQILISELILVKNSNHDEIASELEVIFNDYPE